MVLEWFGKRRIAFTLYNPIRWLKSHLKCNLIIFKDANIRYIRKIMVLVKDNPNDSLAIETTNLLVKSYNADITLVKYIGINSSNDDIAREEKKLQTLSQNCHGQTSFRVISGPDEISLILSETIQYDLLVFGEQEYYFSQNFFKSKDDKIIEESSCSVISVQKGSSDNNL